MLQNIHLMQAWLKDLERALEVIEEFVHDEAGPGGDGMHITNSVKTN